MNALSQIVADPVETAVAAANDWVRVATPVIKAYFAIDEIDSSLRQSASQFRGHVRWNAPQGYEERTMVEARNELKAPIKGLYALIEAIRESAISDAMPRQPRGNATQADWGRYDAEIEEYNERLPREVVSVDMAVKQVGDSL